MVHPNFIKRLYESVQNKNFLKDINLSFAVYIKTHLTNNIHSKDQEHCFPDYLLSLLLNNEGLSWWLGW